MRFFVLVGMMILAANAIGQNKVKWMTWDEAMEAQQVEKRKIFVDVYTDWCKVCKKMDKGTLSKDHIAKYINKNYYAVKFNAESRKPVMYKGNEYRYTTRGMSGFHEFAMIITQGKLKYPTYVFLDENLKIIQPIPGYQDSKTFELIVSYFNEDHYKNTPWRSYVNQYSPDILTQPVKH